MANSLGALVVSLGLNDAEFRSGLTRAEYQAKKFADNLSSSFAAAGKLAGVGLGLIAVAAVSAAKDIVAAASALDDFADQTGSSVEALSKLANQAEIAGIDFSTLQGLVLKLTAGMGDVDDESSKVNKALRALGVSAKDPAQALQQVALELSKYSDGVGKAAIARDLFGKGGPAFLAQLKDIAKFTDVAATTTAKQAEEAEKLEQALRKLSVESTLFKTAILSYVVPAINNVIERFKLAREAGEGFFGSLLRSVTNTDTVNEQIAETVKEIEHLKKAAEAGKRSILPNFMLITDADVAKEQAKLRALQNIAFAGNKLNASRGNDILPPQLKYSSGGGKGGGVGRAEKIAVADYTDEIQRLNDAMDRLTGADGGYTHLAAATAQYNKDVRAGKSINMEQATAFLDTAYAADKLRMEQEKLTAVAKAYREETEKQIKAEEDIIAAQRKATEAFTASLGSYAEQNDVMARELAIVGQSDLAHQKLAATLEYERLVNQAKAAEDVKGLAILDEQYAKRIKLIEGMAEATESLRRIAEVRDAFAGGFDAAFSDLISGTKSVGDAFRSMEKSIVASLSRIAAKKIEEALFGSGTTGGDWISKIAGLFGGSIGGGMPSGSFMPPGGGLAGGTNYARGGPTLIGEHGPEILNIPRGAQIYPNNVVSMMGRRGGMTNNISINLSGNVSSATADQIATKTAAAVQRATLRNG